jgi:hypothetical protein
LRTKPRTFPCGVFCPDRVRLLKRLRSASKAAWDC